MTTTIYSNPFFSDTPYGLKLQQTITTVGTSSVTIPSNIKRVYAVCIGGGGSGGSTIACGGGGGAGGFSAGWTWATNTAIVGNGGASVIDNEGNIGGWWWTHKYY